MGSSIDRLERIKANFRDSHPLDVKLFLEFLNERFTKASFSDPNIIGNWQPLNLHMIMKMTTDLSGISGAHFVLAMDFVEQSIAVCREEDSIDDLGSLEYYDREEKYTRLEILIINLNRI